MKNLKLLFWILAVLFAAAYVFRTSLLSGERFEQMLDPAKKGVQSLLMRAEERIPQEISVDLKLLTTPISESEYTALKERNLFARYRVPEKFAPLKSSEKAGIKPVIPIKKEEPPALFFYKGTLKLGDRQVVILQEEQGGRSFFVGKGDPVLLESGAIEYEVVDITEDEVILLKANSPEEERVTVQRK